MRKGLLAGTGRLFGTWAWPWKTSWSSRRVRRLFERSIDGILSPPRGPDSSSATHQISLFNFPPPPSFS